MTGEWRRKPQRERNQIAEIWSEILIWELEQSRPVLVVTMGRQVQQLLKHLVRHKNINIPKSVFIQHYSYLAYRPQDGLGPMYPLRIEEYDREFAQVANLFHMITKQTKIT